MLWAVAATTHTPQAPRLQAAVQLLRARGLVDPAPEVGIVLGSGFGGSADLLDGAVVVPYAEIPTLPTSTVQGHAGRLCFGRIGATRVVMMQGRVHLYEGHSPADVVFGVRLMVMLGAQTIVLTNAAGGIEPGFRPGDLMLLVDHLNLTAQSCLSGPHEPELGPRFADMSEVYDATLRVRAERAAADLGVKLVGGTYAGVLGPSYETPAEIGMLRTLGADAVGMSTVHEAIAARAMGARCLGISCITNMAAGMEGAILDHAHVQRTAAQAAAAFQRLLSSVLAGN